MEGYISESVVILSGLVMASLQLPLGALLLLYHSSLGKNVRKTTKRLASSFISGATLMIFLLLASSCFLISAFSSAGVLSDTTLSVLFGILLALGVVAWFFYYKRRGSTELWLPRGVAHFIDARAKVTKDFKEAFSLGLLAMLSEILFIIPLLLLAADSVLRLTSPLFQAFALTVFTFLSVLPLIVLRLVLRRGRNVAEVQRWRLKNQTFFRIFSGCGYVVLAAFLLAFVIMGGTR